MIFPDFGYGSVMLGRRGNGMTVVLIGILLWVFAVLRAMWR